jgi:hypothetical protein
MQAKNGCPCPVRHCCSVNVRLVVARGDQYGQAVALMFNVPLITGTSPFNHGYTHTHTPKGEKQKLR